MSRGDSQLDRRAKLCAQINGLFGGVFARESFTLSQGYYYGLALDNPAPDHRCEVIDGRFVDLCNELLKFQDGGFPNSQTTPSPTPTANTGNAKIGKFYDKDFNFEVPS